MSGAIFNGRMGRLLEQHEPEQSDIEQIFRPGEKDGQFVLDPETKFEMTFNIMVLCGMGVTVAGFLSMLESSSYWPAPALGMGMVVLGIFLGFNTDDHYILDQTEQRIFFHRRFFSKTAISPIASYADLLSVCVNGHMNHNKHSTWWTYNVDIVTKDDRVLVVSSELEFESAVKLAKQAAEIVQSQVQPEPKEERHLKASGGILTYQTQSAAKTEYTFRVLAIVVGTFLATGGLIALFRWLGDKT